MGGGYDMKKLLVKNINLMCEFIFCDNCRIYLEKEKKKKKEKRCIFYMRDALD